MWKDRQADKWIDMPKLIATFLYILGQAYELRTVAQVKHVAWMWNVRNKQNSISIGEPEETGPLGR
jgi:hypothetical protein